MQALREALPRAAAAAAAAEVAVVAGAAEPCAALARGGLPLCVGNRAACRFLMLLHAEAQREAEESGEGSGESNMARALRKAAGSLWNHEFLVRTREEAERLKGCGPATGKLLERFFQVHSPQPPVSESEDVARAGEKFQAQLREIRQLASKKRSRGTLEGSVARASREDAGGQNAKKLKEYRPRIGTANYAFLVVLHQSAFRGEEFITKHELMSRAERSGLSNKSIYGERGPAGSAPGSRGGVPHGGFQGSQQFTYNGWSGFKTLKNKDPPLVHSWSNPLKCRLTPEGSRLAEELHRDAHEREMCHCEWHPGAKTQPVQTGSDPPAQVQTADAQERGSNPTAEMFIDLDSSEGEDCEPVSEPRRSEHAKEAPLVTHPGTGTGGVRKPEWNASRSESRETFILPGRVSKPSAPSEEVGPSFRWVPEDGSFLGASPARAPPLPKGKKFLEEYDVVLLVDTRERFEGTGRDGSLSRHLGRLQSMGILVETRGLSIGDALWIAREKRRPHVEYVLDTIVERKGAEDLVQSIKSKRWEKQLWILRRCGLQRRLYLVEGDLSRVNCGKIGLTAAVETEVFEGVKVLRTAGTAETIRMYGQITKSIASHISRLAGQAASPPPTFEQFKARVSVFKRKTVHDIFKLQLMQFPGCGKEKSKLILLEYPTLQHLLKAYEDLEGTLGISSAERKKKCETMLCRIAPRAGYQRISPDLSAKIYKFISTGRV